ncbi:MAG: alpha/beta fold hydrolase [Deltaproteobacteria bacterium]|nr:alpha/beta fold hydrolase [Deltaproteobacteria bacterium]
MTLGPRHEKEWKDEEFFPRPWARNPHVQTFFKSLKLLTPRHNPVTSLARELIVDGGDGSQLLGFHSTHPGNTGRGLILLLHGWEGSADSVYVLRAGKFFFNHGFDIFRLNLRDHGDSHHLNEGLFHGGLIEETHRAVQNIATVSGGKPFYIIGFSLGGNFVLRIALRHNLAPVANLCRLFCISPVLDPYKATVAIDGSNWFYRQYFLKKWLRSLRKKQEAFPEVYSFQDIFAMKTVMEITDHIIPLYSPYDNHEEYFSTYTLRGNAFSNLNIPVTVITAEDDPVIPVVDFHELRGHDCLTVSIQRYGGHCGFLDPFPSGCWYERRILSIIKKD